MKIASKVTGIILVLLYVFISMYFGLTKFSFKYASFLLYIFSTIVFIAFIYVAFFSKYSTTRLISNVLNGDVSRSEIIDIVEISFQKKRKIIVRGMIGVLLIPCLTLILVLSSVPVFRSKSYFNVIDEKVVEKSLEDFLKDFNQLSMLEISNLPNIDSELAQKKATTLFGETKGFGSEYQLGIFTDQIVDGNFVTVAPIEYNGYFKYNKNKSAGTPGYIIVDKENYTSDTGTLMTTNYNIKYLPSSYFSTDLLRHVYFNGYMNRDISVSGFELDDDYNPYWIVNVYQNSVAPYGLKLVTDVVTVDAQTGDVQGYKLEDAPKWIDNIQDASIIMELINYYGSYEQGFFNSLFAQSGVTQTTHGCRHLILNDELYLFTGLTSVGADESISQIVLVNNRTLETLIYNVSGATEYVAMASAEGKLQNYGYEATFPIPVNINNIPTYFIPLKDSSGLIKHYTFVQISNHTVIGAGETIESAYSSYLSLLGSTDSENIETITGNIERINFVDSTGYIYLNGEIYYSPSPSSSTMIVSEVGDNVTIKVIGNLIVEFTNHSL